MCTVPLAHIHQSGRSSDSRIILITAPSHLFSPDCPGEKNMTVAILRFSYPITAAGPSLNFTGFPIQPHLGAPEITVPYLRIGNECQGLFVGFEGKSRRYRRIATKTANGQPRLDRRILCRAIKLNFLAGLFSMWYSIMIRTTVIALAMNSTRQTVFPA